MIRRPPRSTPFPYSTRFRSAEDQHRRRSQCQPDTCCGFSMIDVRKDRRAAPSHRGHKPVDRRSEEHTSELQSRQYLVCRLLLEKKNKTAPSPIDMWSYELTT